MACTCLNELGWHPDVIELQMAHAERNKVRAAYNRAERLGERRKMMQAWADYLDRLRVGRRDGSSIGGTLARPPTDTASLSRKREKVKDGAASQLELALSAGE